MAGNAEIHPDKPSLFASQHDIALRIIESAPMLTYVFDVALQRNIYASPQIAGMLGYSPDEVNALGSTLLPSLIHPEDAPRAEATFRKILASASDELFEVEYRMRHKSGRWIWLWSRDRAIERDNAGRPTRILGVATDITTRKQAEAVLAQQEARMAESERQFRALANAMPQIVWTNEADGRVNYLNQRWLDYTNLTMEESLRNANTPVHPDDRPAAERAWAENVQSRQPFEYEMRIRRHDGEYRWFLARCVPAFDDSGCLTGWYGTSTDIHDRKQAEEALRASEAQFRILSESLPEMLWLADAHGIPLYQNPAWRAYVGLSHEQLLTDGLAQLNHPDESEALLQRWADAQRAGEAFDIDMRMRRHDGAYRWCSGRTAPIKDASGAIVRWIGSITDVHDRRQAEQDAQFLASLADQFIQTRDPQSLMCDVAQSTANHFGVTRAGFVTFDADGKRVTLHRDFHAGGASLAGSYPLGWGQKRLLAQLDAGEPLVVADAATDPRAADYFAAAPASARLRAGVAVPLTRHGRSVALLFIAQAGPRDWTQNEIDLLRTVAERAWLAMESHRVQVETQSLNAILEARVAERTEALNQSREQLRQLTAYVERAREDERSRIAREVHDQLGGALTVLKMSFAQITRRLQPDANVAARLDDFRAQLDALVQVSRRISYDLRPSMLDDFGLLAAIEWQALEWQTRTGIHCQLSLPPDEVTLDSARRTVVYRVFQESLTNVARHADATSVQVQASVVAGEFILTLSDNGRGIGADQVTNSKSMGLMGMRERMHEIDGELEITGASGKGTQVTIRVPLQP